MNSRSYSRKRSIKDLDGRLLDVDQLQAYLNMGRNRAVEFAEACGAKRKLGRKMARYDRAVIDARLNAMHDAEPASEGGAEYAEN